jgi:hypothetical protein
LQPVPSCLSARGTAAKQTSRKYERIPTMTFQLKFELFASMYSDIAKGKNWRKSDFWNWRRALRGNLSTDFLGVEMPGRIAL